MLLRFSRRVWSFRTLPFANTCHSHLSKCGLKARRRWLSSAVAEVATPKADTGDETAASAEAQLLISSASPDVFVKGTEGEQGSSATPPSKGAVLDLHCYALSTTGKGVCRTQENFVVFVPRAIPGETVKVEIRKVDARSAEACKLETVSASPHAVEPPCQHFDVCGGCSHQHISYATQLEQKHNWAVEALRRIGKIDHAEPLMKPPVACPQPFKYRNKMTFALNTSVQSLEKARRPELSRQPTVGLFTRDRPDTVFEVEQCWLQDDTSNRILATIKEDITSIQDRGRIVIEKIVIRQGQHLKKRTPEYMVIFHTWVRPRATPPTAEEAATPFIPLVEKLRGKFPAVVSLFDCRAVIGREKAFPILNRLSGKEFLVHFAGDMPFHVDPLAFFQTNTQMAGKLVEMVYEAADLRKNDTLVDMFCGVGTLGIACAVRLLKQKRPLQMLSGFDIYNQATLNAKANAKILGLKNKTYRFKAGDLTQPTLGATELADVIIADPARSGLGESAILYILRTQARTVVYVSCDIATQARDIAKLTEPTNERAFWLESVQICDMFPQTSHVESVAVLRRDARQLPGYVKPAKKERKKLKPQKIQKQVVPTADLPWVDGGNPDVVRSKATGKAAGTKFDSILGVQLPGEAGLPAPMAQLERSGSSGRQGGPPQIIRDTPVEPNRRTRRDVLFGRKPKPDKKARGGRSAKQDLRSRASSRKSSAAPAQERRISKDGQFDDLDW